VRQVLKGIRAVHPAAEKRARPLQLDVLQQVADWLERGIEIARTQDDQRRLMRFARDRSLLLLGFWRGFRADELVNLRVENVELSPDEGLTCYLPRSKGDRQLEGRTFRCPALSRLCPVAAFEAWIAISGLAEGPAFRGIDRWGNLATERLQPNSIIPLLRGIFAGAGVTASQEYSSHSLRRGFAGWARASGWDLKDLMEYVGWKDIKSAMRYLGVTDASLKARFEQGLPPIAPTAEETEPIATNANEQTKPSPPLTTVDVTLTLSRFSSAVRGITRAHRLIEQMCFERYAMQKLDKAGTQYELKIQCPSREALDDTIYSLLDDMHRIASDNHCFLETSFHEPATGAHWD
jgi:hypothetical protein